MKHLVLALGLVFSISSHADSASLTAFLGATEGNWSGQGTELIQNLGSAAATYNINVDFSTVNAGTNSWTTTTNMTGMPHPSTSQATLNVVQNGLQVVTAQFPATANVKATTATRLVYSTVHTDPVSHVTVTNVREMELLTSDTLHILSDVYQGATLVEHFDYQLQRQ